MTGYFVLSDPASSDLLTFSLYTNNPVFWIRTFPVNGASKIRTKLTLSEIIY